MKKLFLSVAVAGLLFTACNQEGKHEEGTVVDSSAAAPAANADSTNATAAEASNAPVIKLEADTHDFGKIKEGDKVTYAFKFVNSGKSPLIIKDAVATCGCTTPEWPKAPVQPGASGEIKVTFNSANKMGLQDKQITVTANTNPAQTMMHLIGEVTKK